MPNDFSNSMQLSIYACTGIPSSLLQHDDTENLIFSDSDAMTGSDSNSDVISANSNNNMPEVFSCPAEGLFAHYYDCQYYYRCEVQTNGNIKAYLLACKRGTVFSRDLKLCMPPLLANREECQHYINEIDTTPNDDVNGSMDVVDASLDDVNVRGTIFNGGIGGGVDNRWMHAVGGIANNGNALVGIYNQGKHYGLTGLSGVSVISFSTSSARSSSHAGDADNDDDGPECEVDGFISDPNDCTIFYRCISNGRTFNKIGFRCSENTAWDMSLESCNHIFKVRAKGGCQNEQQDLKLVGSVTESSKTSYRNNTSNTSTNQQHHSTSSSSSSSNSSSTSSSSSSSSWLSSTSSSTNHSNAFNNQTTSTILSQAQADSTNSANQNQSPSGTSANNETNSEPAIEHTTTAMKPANSDGECENSETYLPDKVDCSRFYRCVYNGYGSFTIVGFDCAPGTVWDPIARGCNHPTDVQKEKCRVMANERPSPESPGVPKPQKEPSTANSHVSQGAQQSSSSSQASESSQSTQSSSTSENSTSLQTSVTTSQTAQSNNSLATSTSSSHQSSMPATNQMTTTTNTKPFRPAEYCESEESFLDDKTDCTKFYRCVDDGRGGYTMVAFKCPPNTVWHPEANSCNHPGQAQNLKCKMPSTTISSESHSTSNHTTHQSNINETTSSNSHTNSSSVTSQASSSAPQENAGTQSSFQQTNATQSTAQNTVSQTGSTSSQASSASHQESTSSQPASTSHGSSQQTNTAQSAAQNTTSQTSSNNQSSTTTQIASTSAQTNSTTQHTSSSSNNQNSDSVSPTDSCNSNGQYLEDLQNCAKFYRCVQNNKGGYDTVAFTCGPGTVWDSQIEACNHAWAVKNRRCGSNVSQSPTTEGRPPLNSLTTSRPAEQKPTSTIPPSKPATSTTSPRPQAICKTEGFFGDPNNCAKFYRCVNNGRGGFSKYSFKCGIGTVWDSDLQTCNHDMNKCNLNNDESKPQSQPTTNKPGFHPTTTPTTSTSVPPKTTTVTKYPMNTTEYPSSTTIVTKPSTATMKPESNTLLTANSKCPKEGFFGDAEDCQKFYRCVDNKKGDFEKHHFKCENDTIWDAEIEACNHHSAVTDPNCHKESSNGSHTTTATSVTTAVSGSTSLIMSPTTTQSTTESTNIYNTTQQIASTTPFPNLVPGTKCAGEGFMADPENCQKFYRCIKNGNDYEKHEFKCANGTGWSEEKQTCDYVGNIERCQQQIEAHEPEIATIEYEPTTDKHSSTTNASSAQHTTAATAEASTTSSRPITTTTMPTTSQTSPTSYDTTTMSSISTTISTTSTTPLPNLPPDNVCNGEGLMADPNNCRIFYRCEKTDKGYVRHEFMCAKGTGWSEKKQTCDYAGNVQRCESHTENPEIETSTSDITMYPTTTSTEISTTTTGRTPTAITTMYPSTTSTGKPTTTTLNTEPTTPTAVYSNTTAIFSSTITEASSTTEILSTNYYPTTTTQPTSTTTIPNLPPGTKCESEGFMADPNDCRKFYRCFRSGDKYEKHNFVCGRGTAWSEEKQTCDHAGNVDRCIGQTESPETTSTTYETTTSTVAKPTEVATTATSTTTALTQSTQPITTTMETTTVTAQPTTTTMQTTMQLTTTTMQHTTTAMPTSTTQFPPTTTTQRTTASMKPVTTTDSPITTTTQSTSTISSTNKPGYVPTTEPTTTDAYESTTLESINYNCTSEGFFPDLEDCNHYYRCVDVETNGNYQVYSFRCPKGTVWDISLDTCNYADQVSSNCSSGATTTERPQTTSITTTKSPKETTTSTERPETTTTYGPEITTTEKSKDTTTYRPEITSTERPKETTTTYRPETTTTEKSKDTTTTYRPETTTTNRPKDTTTTYKPETTTTEKPKETTTTYRPETTTTEKPKETTTTYRPDTTTTDKPKDTTTTYRPETTTETPKETTTTSRPETTTPPRPEETTSTAIPENTTTENATETTTTHTPETTTIITTSRPGTTTTEAPAETTTTYKPETSTTERPKETTPISKPETTTTDKGKETTSTAIPETTSTQRPNTSIPCPDTQEGQYLFVCPTGFKRHPKNCNMFYQCTEVPESYDHSIVVFECPKSTVFHESLNRCDIPRKGDNCQLKTELVNTLYHDEYKHNHMIKVRSTQPLCPNEGHFPLNDDSCSQLFIKCEYSQQSQRVEGQIYRCPKGFAYWTISRRCERIHKLSNCPTTRYEINNSIPVEWINIGSKRRNMKI
ncbi:hypothetical protein GQX74_014207 [Glossina fuscipes]|nr:hypothetical protein GQX74_014207 [Glossina fuscipes]